MTDLIQFLPGIIAAYTILFVSASSPGPSVAMLIGIAVGQGRTPALITTLGIAVGSVTINIITMLGVGFILSQAAWAMSILRVVGAAYLLFLAFGSFKKAIVPPMLQPADSDNRTKLKHFISGYLLQVTNPKAIYFWLAISSIGAVEGAETGIVVLFIVGAFLISFSCHGAWALALSVSSIRKGYTAGRRWLEAALGCFFAFAAYKLATSDN